MTYGLNPVSGEPAEVLRLLRDWLAKAGPPIEVLTSGSTGEPKRIELAHSAITASAEASLARLGGPGQWLLALPVTGVGGLQVLVRSVVAGQDPVIAADYPSIAEAIAAMTGERKYASFVPTQLFRLIASGEVAVLAELDAILLGGAAAPKELLERAKAAEINLVRTYGMTETCGGCVYDGVGLDGVQVRILSDGRIALAGPMVVGNDGDWLITNDLGELSADGKLAVLGRADQVAVSGGVNIALGAVESVLRDVAGVQDLVVVAQPDPEWGQKVVAFVVGSLDRSAAAAAIAAAGHPRTWTPRQVHLLAELPMLANGKPDRLALAAMK